MKFDDRKHNETWSYGRSPLAPLTGYLPPLKSQPSETETRNVPYKVFYTRDSGEMNVGPDGHPRCPECEGSMQRCGLDDYKCRKCGEGWTLTAIQ